MIVTIALSKMIGPEPLPLRFAKLTLSSLVAIIWLTAVVRAAQVAPPASPTTAPSMVVSSSDDSCSACAVFEFMHATPITDYPSLEFLSSSDDSICQDAYFNVSTYLDQPLFNALEYQTIPDLLSGFVDGDHYCRSDAIMWCARFASRADGLAMQDSILEGVLQVMINYFCAVVPGAYGFTARSSNEHTDEGGDCFPLNVSVLCQSSPIKPLLPPPAFKQKKAVAAPSNNVPLLPPIDELFTSRCAKAPGTTPLLPSPYFIAEPGRSPKTQLYCFDIRPKSVLKQSRCSSEYLLKVEIWADDSKRYFVKGTRLTKNRGTPVWGQPSWGSIGDNTLKVTPLKWTMSEAMGSRICIEVSKAITDLSEICLGGACYVSLFNEDKDCCPVYLVDPEPSPPPPDYFITFRD
ncbi:hypothetical protein Vretimale_6316 [Volvox reticuliferus]|uniref:Pherophorin domain-containing protein n=1 Tax=Volvox reticuliferus TaxID=1737510 RepID=A0A8J4G7D0_9CHLO|nr:hypothetical protein Vretifemale_15985 [Volvox reticuliferus]GIM01531.1 hypothetical protein Vretimale_6316 [Volvox reticuliferus]